MDIEQDVLRTFRLLVRRALKLTPRSSKPMVELLPTDSGVVIRSVRGSTAVCRVLPGRSLERPVALPFHFLEECQARSGIATLTIDGDEARAQWQDGGVPRLAELAVRTVERPSDAGDVDLTPADSRLLTAIAEASSVTDPDSLRYALGCVELSGAHGRVTGTDGKQLLCFSGFDFPWRDDLLVDFGNLFSSTELMRAGDVRVGTADGKFFLQCHPWLIQLPINQNGRFPDVDRVLPDPAAAVCWARLAELDQQFLEQNLSRLPGADRPFSPVTVELNGRVALFAADGANEQVTEVVLTESINGGGEVRFPTDRTFLRRAAKLGLEELCVFAPGRAVLCRSDDCSYAWMPLSADQVAQPAEPTLRIESSAAMKRSPNTRRQVRKTRPRRPAVARKELEQLAAMAADLAGRLRSEATSIAG